MSDPMKSADIEDVLSSIRRLVADTPDGAQAPAADAGNRLVLTPALRVGEDERAQSEAHSPADTPDLAPHTAASDSTPEGADTDAPPPDIEPVEEAAVLEWEDHHIAADPQEGAAPDDAAELAQGAAAADDAPDGWAPATAPQQDDTAYGAGTDAPDLLAEDGVIDEEMLRELVAEIVRQELQGALGERITRNVRKLVRREIHRALSAAEFE